METKPLSRHIHNAARKYQINPLILAAIVQQESTGDSTERRLENGFYRRYLRRKSPSELGGFIPSLVPFEVEVMLRSISWGPCQIMGQTAREFGFDHEWLNELAAPDINIEYGAKIFRNFIEEEGDAIKALLRYNGGGDPSYPQKVLQHIDDNTIKHLIDEESLYE